MRLAPAAFAAIWNACRTHAEVRERTGMRVPESKATALRKAGWDLKYYRSRKAPVSDAEFLDTYRSAPTDAAAAVLLGMTPNQCSVWASRLRKRGVPVPFRRRGTLAEVVGRSTRKGPGCWAWVGGTDSDGVGRVKRKRDELGGGTPGRGYVTARRAAWLADGRECPLGHSLIPTCGNIFCVRPDHLKAVGHSAESRRLRQAEGLPSATPKVHPLTCSACGTPFFGERRQKRRAEIGKPVSCGCRKRAPATARATARP